VLVPELEPVPVLEPELDDALELELELEPALELDELVLVLVLDEELELVLELEAVLDDAALDVPVDPLEIVDAAAPVDEPVEVVWIGSSPEQAASTSKGRHRRTARMGSS
jgi:hypothetical protein